MTLPLSFVKQEECQSGIIIYLITSYPEKYPLFRCSYEILCRQRNGTPTLSRH